MEETLNKFLTTIEERSQQEIAELQKSVSQEHQDKINAARTAAYAAAERYKETECSNVESAGELKIAARSAENRRKVLEFRKGCAEKTTARAAEKLQAYTAGKDYPSRMGILLKQGVKALGAKGSAVVYLRQEDMKIGKSVCAACRELSLEIREGDFALGGLMVEYAGRRADLTFDTALRDAEDHFGEISGLALS